MIYPSPFNPFTIDLPVTEIIGETRSLLAVENTLIVNVDNPNA
jgi:hypothetical protein